MSRTCLKIVQISTISKPVLTLMLVAIVLPMTAQRAVKPLKPTEALVRTFERLVAAGSLLTPDGWSRTNQLFEKLAAYPAEGEIEVVSVGGAVGEDWVKGNRAQVETKWNDLFGTIDGRLRFKPSATEHLAIGEIFSVVFVGQESPRPDEKTARQSEWKFADSLHVRSATIPAAIKYLEKMRDKSTDPVIRRNANKSITELRYRIRTGPSACAC